MISPVPPSRDKWQAISRGFAQRCPACGTGAMYRAYLKVNDACSACGEELHHHRADDAPPYMTIFVVGHIIVPAMILVERRWSPDLWLQALVWAPLTLGLTLAILPRIKGALVGLQWALRMHGFDKDDGKAADAVFYRPNNP